MKAETSMLYLLSQRPDATGSGIYTRALLDQAANQGIQTALLAGIPADYEPQVPHIDPERCDFVCFDGVDLPHPIVGMSDVMPYPSQRFSALTPAEITVYEAVFVQKVQDLVARYQPDIIHSNHLWLMTSVVRQIVPDIPLVVSCHGSDIRQFRQNPHLQNRVKAGCQIVDAVLALTDGQKHEICELYDIPAERIHVVGAGYNDQLFQSKQKPAAPPVELIYVGKLSRAKGVPWLLRALGTITDLDWRFHLVGSGSGPEAAESRHLADQLGDRVIQHGAIPQPDLVALLQRTHVFVLPSFYEGFPLVTLEALACGCRAIVTGLAPVQEVWGHVDSEALTLVPCPRLMGIDIPHRDDGHQFEDQLTAAMREQIVAAKLKPQPDFSPITSILRQYTWAGLFEQIQGVYKSLI